MKPATPLPSPPAPEGPGRHHQLLRQHLTNMTSMQVAVCNLAIDEYEVLAQRAVMLESENAALLRQVADLVRPKPARATPARKPRTNGR